MLNKKCWRHAIIKLSKCMIKDIKVIINYHIQHTDIELYLCAKQFNIYMYAETDLAPFTVKQMLL